jgi:small basic protein
MVRDIMLWESVAVAVIAAALRCFLGWLKSNEKFSINKLIRTVAFNITVAGIIGFLWYDMDVRVLFATVFTSSVAIEDLLKGIIRKWPKMRLSLKE